LPTVGNVRLLKNPVQHANLPRIGSLTEEKQRTDRGLAAAGCHPKRLCACPGWFFNSLICFVHRPVKSLPAGGGIPQGGERGGAFCIDRS